MSDETTKIYRGVVCRRCGEPIPTSAKVTRLKDEIERQSSAVNAPHSFVARCRACEFENAYAIGDIRTFSGEPRRRTRRAQVAHA